MIARVGFLAAVLVLAGCSGSSDYSQKSTAPDEGAEVPERFVISNYPAITENTGDYTGIWLFTQQGSYSSSGSDVVDYRRGLVFIRQADSDYELLECHNTTANVMVIDGTTLTSTLYDADLALTMTDENTMTGATTSGEVSLATEFKKVLPLSAEAFGSFTLVVAEDEVDFTDDPSPVRCFTELMQQVSGDSGYDRTRVTVGDWYDNSYGFITVDDVQWDAGGEYQSVSVELLRGSDAYSYSDDSQVNLTLTVLSTDAVQAGVQGAVGSSGEFSSEMSAELP